MNTADNASFEIDVFALLKKLWNRKFLILFVALLFGFVALFVSVFIIPKTYTSSTRVYVVNNSTNNSINYQDIQAGTDLVNDYKEIIQSQDVLDDVVSKEKLDISSAELSKKISVQVPTDTRLITISVKDKSAQEASRLANAVREVAIQKIKDVTKVEDVTTAETAKVPSSPTSPSIKKNLVLGVVAGGFIAVVTLIIFEALDDRIKTSEDIEKVLGRTLLGVVPDTNSL
ncbi:Wzz/FepE/Etk N-terminal domain-containing protein [Streptococcus sobrinus]|uniref:Capsular polysaccharide biosynthesis protein CpsC n=1 Tax=Streptococcus sobrinus TaxID=1310 RepID=A0ABN5LKA5_9STRE|nr:Wzz/FepE/Etk N-terminal domain-containing protein [Streptococcus sobrinus]AWN21394.1 capsular biosynthesis protein CpsC [Streptococcus sobrinus]EMP70752.1 chain length determinant protein [Streptococcus sobrinus DSM 20742 = ATCC 33478]SQG14204.1 chain length determinant protein [Streptococcus sobrinus]